jgi:hypothetical protein
VQGFVSDCLIPNPQTPAAPVTDPSSETVHSLPLELSRGLQAFEKFIWVGDIVAERVRPVAMPSRLLPFRSCDGRALRHGQGTGIRQGGAILAAARNQIK